jgi:hypothetical protein
LNGAVFLDMKMYNEDERIKQEQLKNTTNHPQVMAERQKSVKLVASFSKLNNTETSGSEEPKDERSSFSSEKGPRRHG